MRHVSVFTIARRAGGCLPAWASVLAVGLAGNAWAHQAPERAQAETAAVARAFFDALATGNPERFEAMALEHYATDLLVTQTAAARRAFFDRIRGEFGTLTLEGVFVGNAELVRLGVRGSTGLAGRIELVHAAGPPHRILSVGVNVGTSANVPPGPPGPPIAPSMTPAQLQQAIDAWLAARASANEFSGVVAVAHDGVMVYQGAVGLADREANTPVTVDTRFSVASIGRFFTRVAIARLLADGRIALDSTIGDLLPDHPDVNAKAATVGQLLSSPGDIADPLGAAFDATPWIEFASNADYYRVVSGQPLAFGLETDRRPCDGCFIVLGQVIERVTGRRYEDYVAEHVFTPARMTHTGFFRWYGGGVPVAQPYSRQLSDGSGALRNAREAYGPVGSAAGGVMTTAADLLAFGQAFRTDRLGLRRWLSLAQGPPSSAGARGRGGFGMMARGPGVSCQLSSSEHWAVAVVSNLDPPAAADVSLAIMGQLVR